MLGCIFLEKLPDGIGKLINLRYLITSNCGNLKYYPKGIARLNCLRELDCIIAQGSKDPKKFSVGDLENLGLLREELKVKLVGNTFHVEEAKGAKLHNKIHLQNLTILNAREYNRKVNQRSCCLSMAKKKQKRVVVCGKKKRYAILLLFFFMLGIIICKHILN